MFRAKSKQYIFRGLLSLRARKSNICLAMFLFRLGFQHNINPVTYVHCTAHINSIQKKIPDLYLNPSPNEQALILNLTRL